MLTYNGPTAPDSNQHIKHNPVLNEVRGSARRQGGRQDGPDVSLETQGRGLRDRGCILGHIVLESHSGCRRGGWGEGEELGGPAEEAPPG